MMSRERQRKSLIAFFLGTTAATREPESPEVIGSASRRAYRDLSRTIHGMGSHTGAEVLREETDQSIVEFVTKLDGIQTSDDFDTRHEEWCAATIARFSKSSHPDPEREFGLTYGQAQKWLNMALKYLAVVGNESLASVYGFLHVPIDRVIYKQARNLDVSPPEKTAWSRLTREQYQSYQYSLRNKIKAEYGADYAPLNWEIDEWTARD